MSLAAGVANWGEIIGSFPFIFAAGGTWVVGGLCRLARPALT